MSNVESRISNDEGCDPLAMKDVTGTPGGPGTGDTSKFVIHYSILDIIGRFVLFAFGLAGRDLAQPRKWG
jgi:hypothetical protein